MIAFPDIQGDAHLVCDGRVPVRVERNTVTIARNAQRTSIAAARRTLPRTGSIRKRIYDYLQQSGGATDEQIEDALHISGNSVRPSRGSLVEDGLVFDTGTERPTKSGNMAIVWAVA
jgi:hypothetical protein